MAETADKAEANKDSNADYTKLSKEQEKLWDFIVSLNNAINQQFATMVVGIGALFFAYGQTYALSLFHLRVVIAFIGLGASFIIMLTHYNVIKDRERIEIMLEGTYLMDMYKAAVSWRGEGLNGIFYPRVTRLMLYFSLLVSLIWLEIVITDMSYSLGKSPPFSFDEYLWFNVLVVAGLAALTFIKKYQDNRS